MAISNMLPLLTIILFWASSCAAFCVVNQSKNDVTFYIVPPSSDSFKKVVAPSGTECCAVTDQSCFADKQYSSGGAGTGGGIAFGNTGPADVTKCDKVAMLISQGKDDTDKLTKHLKDSNILSAVLDVFTTALGGPFGAFGTIAKAGLEVGSLANFASDKVARKSLRLKIRLVLPFMVAS